MKNKMAEIYDEIIEIIGNGCIAYPQITIRNKHVQIITDGTITADKVNKLDTLMGEKGTIHGHKTEAVQIVYHIPTHISTEI